MEDDFDATDQKSQVSTSTFGGFSSLFQKSNHHAENWNKYVTTFLPLERSTDFTKEEQVVIEAVKKVVTPAVWDSLSKEFQLNIIRGNAHEKERLKVTSHSATIIHAWRMKYNVEGEMLTKGPLPGFEKYFKGWPTRVAGVDMYGHPILYDRLSILNFKELAQLTEDDFYKFRTQALEALAYLKHEISNKINERVGKHVYILDLAGLDVTVHFTQAMQKKMKPVMQMSADMYPETLWCTWIINAPMTFRVVWNVVRTWLDPVIRAKVRVFGPTKAKWHEAMSICGIPTTALPSEFGGSSVSEGLHDILKRAAASKTPEESTIQVSTEQKV